MVYLKLYQICLDTKQAQINKDKATVVKEETSETHINL